MVRGRATIFQLLTVFIAFFCAHRRGLEGYSRGPWTRRFTDADVKNVAVQ
jgi:hypothetical protein